MDITIYLHAYVAGFLDNSGQFVMFATIFIKEDTKITILQSLFLG